METSDNTAPLASVTIPEIDAVAVCPRADKPETRIAVINTMQRGIYVPLSFGQEIKRFMAPALPYWGSIHLVFRNKNTCSPGFVRRNPFALERGSDYVLKCATDGAASRRSEVQSADFTGYVLKSFWS